MRGENGKRKSERGKKNFGDNRRSSSETAGGRRERREEEELAEGAGVSLRTRPVESVWKGRAWDPCPLSSHRSCFPWRAPLRHWEFSAGRGLEC